MAEWKVENGAFVDNQSRNTLKASCHHRRSGACGGCYARLTNALALIESESADAGRGIAEEVLRELRAEGVRLR